MQGSCWTRLLPVICSFPLHFNVACFELQPVQVCAFPNPYRVLAGDLPCVTSRRREATRFYIGRVYDRRCAIREEAGFTRDVKFAEEFAYCLHEAERRAPFRRKIFLNEDAGKTFKPERANPIIDRQLTAPEVAGASCRTGVTGRSQASRATWESYGRHYFSPQQNGEKI